MAIEVLPEDVGPERARRKGGDAGETKVDMFGRMTFQCRRDIGRYLNVHAKLALSPLAGWRRKCW